MRPLFGDKPATPLQLLSHQSRQTLLQFAEPLSSFSKFSAGMSLIEATLQPYQTLSALLDRALQCRRQALLDFIDALCALTQSNAGMQLIQSSIEP
jgi:hypothetical protein